MAQHHHSNTPCPVPAERHASAASGCRDSLHFDFNDSALTSTLDFTSAFVYPLRNVKPRRAGARAQGDASRSGFTIYDEAAPDNALVPNDDRLCARGKTAVLKQPARRAGTGLLPQRPKAKVTETFVSSLSESDPGVRPADDTGVSKSRPRTAQPPLRRPVARSARLGQHLAPLSEDNDFDLKLTRMPKPVRRGTIYIPTEDTTMPSMHMGVFSPIKDLDTRAIAEAGAVDSEITGIAAEMVKKRAVRRSLIAVSPKRAPLQLVSQFMQESALPEDRYGQGAGKENVPPGHRQMVNEGLLKKPRMHTKSTDDDQLASGMARLRVKAEYKPPRLPEATASSMGEPLWGSINVPSKEKDMCNPGAQLDIIDSAAIKRSTKASPPQQVHEQGIESKSAVPTRFVIPIVKSEVARQSYPLLPETLATPAMYEDNWLSHQEIAITQLVNNLFGAMMPNDGPADNAMSRIRLVEIYNNAETAMLFKRIQGALLYGALRAPTEVQKNSTKLNSDIGRRRAFANLWLDTYDTSCLKTALEVVVGRQCEPFSSELSSSRTNSREDAATYSRGAMRRFIETFLIRNEDGEQSDASSSHESWCYQRTLLRSIMLIKLLDLTPIRGCLFQSSSLYKSSISVVRALFQTLNPSAGDPTRALAHIGYSVCHVQDSLREYDYKIQNLAVDLRDGVRLTKLVELLLPSTGDHPWSHEDARSPIGPLSQQLKIPCLGRATKAHNIQIALTALHGVEGIEALIQDISAEDLVDGFREKTIRLLWGLTSKWGLGGLVDWADVDREIKRLRRSRKMIVQDNHNCASHGTDGAYSRYQNLLISWAQAIASLRGIMVQNWTAGLADGRVFESIVDEYERYNLSNSVVQGRRSLSERLRSLGCSDQFAGLFSRSDATSNRKHIFNDDFVMAALAFLCSRLLGPSKTVRAAVMIQAAWRRHWSRVVHARRNQLKLLAEECPSTVQIKDPRSNTRVKYRDDRAEGWV